MVDLSIEVIGAEQGPPSLEDGMGHLQDTDIGLDILR